MIYEVLRGVPGVSVRHLGNPAYWTYIRTRGGGDTHTKVLINGMDFTVDPTGVNAADFGFLDAENIERIEIVKGPQSALYGSDAMSGVINIITKKGRGKPKFYLKSEGGSMDMFRGSGGVNGEIKGLSYNLNFSHDEGGGHFSHDEYEKEFISGRFGYQLSEDTILDLHLSYTDNWLNGVENPYPYTKTYDDPRAFRQIYLFFSGVALNQKLTSWWNHKLYYAYNHTKNNYDDPDDGLIDATGGIVDKYSFGKYEGSVDKVSWQHNISLGKIDTLTVGFEYNETDGKITSGGWYSVGGKIKKYDESTNNKSYFLQNQILLLDEALSFTCGGRLDDHSEFGDHTTYKLALAYLFEDIGLKLKTTYGTGFKAPSMFNLYDPKYGNPNLEPEESESWDVGFEQSFFQDRVVFEATYFHNDFDDLIAFDRRTYRYANRKTAETEGVEVGLNIYPRYDMSLSFNYTYTDGEEDGKDLTGIPKDEWYFNFTYNPGKLEASIDIYSVGKKWGYYHTKRIDSWYRVDLSASYQLKHWLELFGRIENLFDEDYEEAMGYYTPGFSAWGGVKLTF